MCHTFWITILVVFHFIIQSSTEQCRGYSANMTSANVKGYQSSQFKNQKFPVENAFDGNKKTFIQTECMYGSQFAECVGTATRSKDNKNIISASFLDGVYEWVILNLNISVYQFIKSITISSVFADILNRMDIMVASDMTRVPLVTYGFRGIEWSEYILCGNTGLNLKTSVTITCAKAQNTRYVAIRRRQETIYNLITMWSLYFSEVEVAFYQIQPTVSVSGEWSEKSTGDHMLSVCSPGLLENFKFKWYQEYFNGSSKYLGKTSANTLSLTSVTRINAGKYYVKYVSSETGQVVATSSKLIFVKYNATIREFPKMVVVNEGGILKLKCVSSFGYPAPTLRLLIEDTPLNASQTNTSDEYGGTSQRVTFSARAKKEWNGKSAICELKQSNNNILSRSVIHVYYESKIVEFSYNKLKFREGETLKVFCRTSAGFPPPCYCAAYNC